MFGVLCLERQGLANSEFHFGMAQLELDAPYFCPNFVGKYSLGQSTRRCAPCVWQKDFGIYLVAFRCVIWCNVCLSRCAKRLKGVKLLRLDTTALCST